MPIEMQKIHERIMRYEELQIAKKETEALKEVRGMAGPSPMSGFSIRYLIQSPGNTWEMNDDT